MSENKRDLLKLKKQKLFINSSKLLELTVQVQRKSYQLIFLSDFILQIYIFIL